MFYSFAVTCPRCGNEMRHVADGSGNPHGTAVIAACVSGCRDRWVIRVTATSCRSTRQAENEFVDKPRNCGSPTGYRDHVRDGEDPCDDCRDALAASRAVSRPSRARVDA